MVMDYLRQVDQTIGILIVSLLGALAIVAVLAGSAMGIAKLIIAHRERMAIHRERLAMIGMGHNPDHPDELPSTGAKSLPPVSQMGTSS